ncbi:MAG: hypothetical protein MZW92_10040 [Comamonadaceae bacterium]|nr:hypothetical protein [Comamonadaceae bacterium]
MNFVRKKLSPLAMPQEIEFVDQAAQDAQRQDHAPRAAARKELGRADRRHQSTLDGRLTRTRASSRSGSETDGADEGDDPRLRHEGVPRRGRRPTT